MTNLSRRRRAENRNFRSHHGFAFHCQLVRGAAGDEPIKRKGNIKQSVSRWCYQKIPLEQLCEYSAKIGLKAVDLLEVSEWEVPRRYGLICSMGYARRRNDCQRDEPRGESRQD